ncbi:MAG: sigma-54-dependent Fis family transcriptional regulator [Nitrospina sp.]|jgi:DNA-binding NtrC family response regulator|nr:sigma-54-dependent Fis family transcriptional regulator [Nitrospina sp.]MBT6717180.1 sigma-54-dependent Fis family transcriptional regulator [Nitrospina sp.]
MSKLLFVVDNEVPHREMMANWLEDQGFKVKVFDNGELCLNCLDENPGVICLDINMPGMPGLEILKRLRLANRDIPVMVVTKNDTLDSAIEAMKMGAFDYMVKPVDKIRLKTNVDKAIEMHTMVAKIQRLQGELKKTYSYKNIVGNSEPMRQIFGQVDEVSGININVFIGGESGTGKELVAKAIHFNSAYKSGDFVAINCGAIPEELQENEFFGHEKGAFTGADDSRPGKLEAANGGTLFLDEIGEMSPKMQVKLLRFLQDKSFEKVGGTKKINVDLRIISATNRNLEDAVKEGRFREDLYYRLMVYLISLPPLRIRKDDIPLLINHFLKKYKNEIPKNISTVSSYAMEALIRYPWPGNVRQLENEVYRAMVTTQTNSVQIENLSSEIQKLREGYVDQGNQFIPNIESHENKMSSSKNHPQSISPSLSGIKFDEIEKNALIDALDRANGNIPLAAKELGISRATFYRKIKKYRSAS